MAITDRFKVALPREMHIWLFILYKTYKSLNGIISENLDEIKEIYCMGKSIYAITSDVTNCHSYP
jgi:hypothetical protein